VLLDNQEPSKKITVSGNNQLLKGAIFALISLVWFFFLFAFINMDWEYFNPITTFSGEKEKDRFVFYFIAFSFFISSLIFSLIFYKNNLLPTDILLRFAIILIVFVLVYFFYLLVTFGLDTHKRLFVGGITFMKTPGTVMIVLNILLTFVLFYLLFYPMILIFTKMFFNGFFGVAGFVMCFFLTAIFHISVYLLSDIEVKMSRTSFPVPDLIVILFFTLLSFGIGVASGEEPKKRLSGHRKLSRPNSF